MFDDLIEAVTESRQLAGNLMAGTNAESDPDDWAMLCAKYAKYHAVLNALLKERRKEKRNRTKNPTAWEERPTGIIFTPTVTTGIAEATTEQAGEVAPSQQSEV